MMKLLSSLPSVVVTTTTLLALFLLLVSNTATQAQRVSIKSLRFIGSAEFETGFTYKGREIGGLSGIEYDPDREVYYLITDDDGEITKPRFYHVTIDLSDGTLDEGDIRFRTSTPLRGPDGRLLPNGNKAESIRLDAEGETVYCAMEDPDGVPQVVQFGVDGTFLRVLETPRKFLTFDGAFSSLALLSRKNDVTVKLVTATETAREQDGSEATLEEGSACRFLEMSAAAGKGRREWVYVTEPIPQAPDPADGFADNGLVELLSLGSDKRTFLAMERSFAVGVGNTIQIYEAATRQATNVRSVPSLLETMEEVEVVEKKLILYLDNDSLEGVTLDNMEGMTFGPDLPSGEKSLIMVSDNNYNEAQRTLFLAFAVEEEDEDEED